MFVAGLAFLLVIILSGGEKRDTGTVSLKKALGQYIGEKTAESVWNAFMPVFSYVQTNGSGSLERMASRQIKEMIPLFDFGQTDSSLNASQQDEMTLEMILMAEAEEDSLEALFEEENREAGKQLAPEVKEEQSVSNMQSSFVPRTTVQAQVDMTALMDYETLLQTFYTVDKSTEAVSELLNVQKFVSADLSVSKDSPGPQILIYHTHSQEAFADSVPGDRSTSIVGVGDRLTRILTENYGYQVLHHDASYDLPSRDDAYSVALPEIEKILEENPQIQVVIDLHRDAVDEGTKLVMDLDGRPTARFMFFNGLSRTRKTGNISYLYNENLEDNLAFSFQMQKTALEYYPGLTRKVYLKAYRYNMHLRPRNLLVELGAQNNTVEEAMNACDPLAHILDMVLSGQ